MQRAHSLRVETGLPVRSDLACFRLVAITEGKPRCILFAHSGGRSLSHVVNVLAELVRIFHVVLAVEVNRDVNLVPRE